MPKKHALWFIGALCGLLANSAQAQVNWTEYPVKQVDRGSSKFQRIYSATKKSQQEQAKQARIVQHVEGRHYLARFTASSNADEDQLVAVKLREGRSLQPDGSLVSLRLVLTDQTYQFKGFLGAERTLRLYEEAPELTITQFISELKAGQRFRVTMPAPKTRCTACGGFGGSSLHETTCQTCEGKGFLESNLHFELYWH